MNLFYKFDNNNIKALHQNETIDVTTIVTVPETITVHLGTPDEVAEILQFYALNI